LGLYSILKTNQKEINLFVDGEIPFNYTFLPSVEKVLSSPDLSIRDLVIVLDCSDKDRLGTMSVVFDNARNKVCIDHHVSNTNFCDINIIEPSYSSTGEMVYEISKIIGLDVDKSAAECIYSAILSDTGKFIYDNTSPQTLRFVAELLEKNIDFNDIVIKIYSSDYKNVFLAKSKIISDTEFYFNDKLSIAVITQDILEEFDVKMKDIDGVVETIRDVKDVEISCVLKEFGEEKTKVSLRSKGEINVSEISTVFKGGGHAKAAGFNIERNIEKSKAALIEFLKQYLEA
jgi:phosphoesterase RecJ-like protein